MRRFPIHFVLESFRSGYKYFHKHYGIAYAKKYRIVTLANLWIRRLVYGSRAIFYCDEAMKERIKTFKAAIEWNSKLNVNRFIE